MSERRHPNIINIDETEAGGRETGRFAFNARLLASETGATQLGCNLFEIAPQKTAFPAHYHCGIEEAIYILEGSGTARMGDEQIAVRAGDFISYPIGPEHSHQLINDGDGPLRYLCMSTKTTADVVGYPDSDKIAALSAAPGAAWGDSWVSKWYRADDDVEYFEGEDTGD